jgi:hypothetical protein
MNLYLVTQKVNDWLGGTYGSFVVAAPDEDGALKMHPDYCDPEDGFIPSWFSKENVSVTLIGKAEQHIERGLIDIAYHPEGSLVSTLNEKYAKEQ